MDIISKLGELFSGPKIPMSASLHAALDKFFSDFDIKTSQLDTMGRILLLKNDELISKIDVDSYCDTTLLGERRILLKSPIFRLSVNLNKKIKDEDHEKIKMRIENTLEAAGLKSSALFSYCSKSFGLELNDVDVHFGF